MGCGSGGRLRGRGQALAQWLNPEPEAPLRVFISHTKRMGSTEERVDRLVETVRAEFAAAKGKFEVAFTALTEAVESGFVDLTPDIRNVIVTATVGDGALSDIVLGGAIDHLQGVGPL